MNFAKKRNPGLEMAVILLLGGVGFGLASCSSEPHRVDTTAAADANASSVAQAVGADDASSYVAEVTFDRGSAALKPDSKRKLDELVRNARANGKVDDIKVIGWADKTFPATSHRDLPAPQRQLAEKRVDNIKDYLRKSGSLDSVDTFNMAEKPSKVSEWLNTENARVKRSLASAGFTETGSPTKAGKAMVLVVTKKISRE